MLIRGTAAGLVNDNVTVAPGRSPLAQSGDRKARRELATSNEGSASFRALFAANPLPMWIYDLETLAFLEVNEAAVAKYGYGRDEFLGMRITDIRPAEDVPTLLADVARERPALQQSGRWRHRLRSGEPIDVEINSHTLTFADRRAALVVAQDVTARLHAERSLSESEARKAAMLEAALDAVVAIDAEGRITEFNPAAERTFGYRRADVLGRPIVETIVPPELRDRHRAGFARYLATGESTILGRRLLLTGMRSDGAEFPVELTVYRVPLPGPPAFGAFLRDLTESRRLEEQLLQAQKMESVGRLAGGIAHDFNNILTAISGYAYLALDRPGLEPAVREDLEQIRTAAGRAVELTSQLLAFSRRQVMQPVALDLGDALREISPMLRRLLGEDIRLVTSVGPNLGHVLADPGQLTQVIVNLAVNARDAMPTGGGLTLEAANVDLDAEYAQGHAEVVPGPFVVLSVTDSGAGMDEATRARIFEPFFTTKAQGKGTGLGLATVYGIVRQSGGHIWVYSEPDRGTVFKVYLPRVEAATGARLTPAVRPRNTEGTETILVVEDDEGVRAFVQAVLEGRGYRVLRAANADEALTQAAHDGPIELLLTDVVMPGVSGADLAARVRAIAPAVKVLFVSGYTENTIVHHGVLDADVSFLAKPFSPDALAERVRAELDS
jgi:two-component system cell cycle sensor histidine kinase/response regulator CckA